MNRIYLIGFMGCGKSTLGKLLADELQWAFVDLDQLIVNAEGQPIADIFRDKGEKYFREREREQLHLTSQLNNYIIATGGGAPCYFDNIDWINENGISIYLNPTVDALVTRLIRNKTQRPLIKHMDEQELPAFVSNLLHDREPIYTCSSYVFNIPSNETSSQSLERLVMMLNSTNN